MTKASFRISYAGPHVTIQDAGRPGLMRYGVPASGPMDRRAFAIANAILGNPSRCAAGIEVSLGGLQLECLSGRVTGAIAGGGFVVQHKHERLGSWHVLTISAGQKLAIRPGPWGSWTYLCFAGDLQAPDWLGSRATHASSGLGGGRLSTGQILTIDNAQDRPAALGPIACPVWARPRRNLRCVLGPQDRFFAHEALRMFTSLPYTLTDACDRMGVRLRGAALVPDGALSIPSEPILRGSVQVSGDGVLTVLLSDHQTTGGYPKIATILSDDTDGLVQCRPHDVVRFLAVTPAEATAIALSRARSLAAYFTRLAISEQHSVSDKVPRI